MVTIYLAGTSIRLESKMAVSEYALEKYKMFKEEMPKEFSISKTRRGCFAYLNQKYTGSDVVAQAANLDDENGKIIASLVKMKTEDELNLNSCVRVLKGCGHDLLADWVYGKLATTLEKQDEQEPVDKAEPKFKVGDWIITPENEVLQITSIEGTSYRFNNESSYWRIRYCDEKCHLWTIQDAKCGDVLATKSENVFVFKGLLDRLHPKSPVAYCGNNDLNDFFISGSNDNRWTDEAVVPATEEQRDLLFQKMKEAGYTFDFEKKELRKIEQKPDWSEEDEEYLSFVIAQMKILQVACTEDEIKQHSSSQAAPYYTKIINWLKSIRLQNTWKPSDEQMKALDAVLVYNPPCSNECRNHLITLYDDLKKLR